MIPPGRGRAAAAALGSTLAVWACVPGWSGEARAPRMAALPLVRAERVGINPQDPGRTRVGRLTFLGGVRLSSPDPAFGGYSAIAVKGDRVTLLSDGGGVLRFRLTPDWQVRGAFAGRLAGGPGSGWEKRDRDSESLAMAPDGTVWVGFEAANAVARYAPNGRLAGMARPRAMRRWSPNGGVESLARLSDGRFVAISESERGGMPGRRRGRRGLIFAGDPTRGARAARFTYLPPRGFSPSDAAALPDGGLIVVNRRFVPPYRFRTAITRTGPVAAGATLRTEVLALLDQPLLHDNFEGIAIVQDGAGTNVWLVSDDNESVLQDTLLLKFRLDTPKARVP